ncbi:helix-turn-helix domain-containing protein [Nocardia terpenica]|uniref:helix-turn-helix domain-containing protein n=1 Tax=Nocardia terpenica TaxID=455432 RepID=UPI003A5C1A6C
MLEQELVKGAVAHGWPDQTWTLARIRTLIGHRFHKSLSLESVSQLLHRHGWSHQVPARRAVERDPQAITGWVKDTWPRVKAPRRRSGHGWSSRTKPVSR